MIPLRMDAKGAAGGCQRNECRGGCHRGGIQRCRTYGGSGRTGMTLLEVLLAMIVLVAALGAISQAIMNGRYSASESQTLTDLQLLCTMKMDSIVVGLESPDATTGSFPEYPDYQFETVTQNPGTPGLLSVRVTVKQNSTFANPLEYSLVRWIPDPNFELETAQ